MTSTNIKQSENIEYVCKKDTIKMYLTQVHLPKTHQVYICQFIVNSMSLEP